LVLKPGARYSHFPDSWGLAGRRVDAAIAGPRQLDRLSIRYLAAAGAQDWYARSHHEITGRQIAVPIVAGRRLAVL
jgi:hypothetical protein